jgi:YD repeat-containing protein
VRQSGQAVCWGEDDNGRLGDNDGENLNESYPVAISGVADYLQISAGYASTCGKHADGKVTCWGYNNQGQVGEGTTTDRLVSTELAGIAPPVKYVEADTGWSTSCAVTDTGEVYCWGENNNGELGQGNTTEYWAPVRVPGIGNASDVQVAENTACALLVDGTVRCWGRNDLGQCGDGSNTQRLSPVPVSGLSGVVEIAGGTEYFCAIKSDKTAWCWGYNPYGNLGDNTVTSRNSPVQVHGIDNVGMLSGAVAIGGGHYYHACAVLDNGTAVCWGLDDGGQLGDDNVLSTRYYPRLVQGGHTDFAGGRRKIDGGRYQSCALKTDGSAWCWGYDAQSKCGDGTPANPTYNYAPAVVAGGHTFTRIGGLSEYISATCAVRTDGQVWCWGRNDYGSMGIETSSGEYATPQRVHHAEAAVILGNTDIANPVVSVAVGDEQALAVHQNGIVTGWGSGGSGRLGNGYTDERTYPTPVAANPGI